MSRTKYAEEEFLEVLEELSPATTTEIAEKIGCAEKTAYYRLHELEEGGKCKKKKSGPRVLIWSVEELRDEDARADDDSGEQEGGDG